MWTWTSFSRKTVSRWKARSATVQFLQESHLTSQRMGGSRPVAAPSLVCCPSGSARPPPVSPWARSPSTRPLPQTPVSTLHTLTTVHCSTVQDSYEADDCGLISAIVLSRVLFVGLFLNEIPLFPTLWFWYLEQCDSVIKMKT